jgi:hypothetical protein
MASAVIALLGSAFVTRFGGSVLARR